MVACWVYASRRHTVVNLSISGYHIVQIFNVRSKALSRWAVKLSTWLKNILIHANLWVLLQIVTSNVSQTDLVFGL